MVKWCRNKRLFSFVCYEGLTIIIVETCDKKKHSVSNIPINESFLELSSTKAHALFFGSLVNPFIFIMTKYLLQQKLLLSDNITVVTVSLRNCIEINRRILHK